MTRLLLVSAIALALTGCPGGRTRPAGPAPEYERPAVEPWDAGKRGDPLDDVEGEEVTDEPETPADAGKTLSSDAGAADAGG